MTELVRQKERAEALRGRLDELRGYLEISEKLTRIGELEKKMAAPDFWNDREGAKEVIGEANLLKSWTRPWADCSARMDDLFEMTLLLEDEDDAELEAELEAGLGRAEAEAARLASRNMLRGVDAHRSALVTINPGAGGTESQDWARMLMRMYVRWAEQHDYDVEVMDLLPAEEAGIKSATLDVDGQFAYGYLSAERGVHRLVRISPFDSQRRRHTSFASVFVYPVVDEDIEVAVNEEELRVDTFRASGAGGQHVNKTDSAVRITHLPTGIVVSCQQERSQHKNKSKAMKMLQAALYQRAVEEREARRAELEGAKTRIEWGRQIRSYVLQPYKMVKDHRTNLEVGNVDAVLDGEIDGFIQAFLQESGKTNA
ncbi:peptide chain release factor 2 [Candidatus Palauibacter sp.]|uniref:peptide chain release factor 2 n=1 Tax=Candidatus Palauibacter sp. TaxID=3101350 RepID=UPI003B01046A